MKAIGVWESGFRSRLQDGRGHEVTIDLPADEDGGNAGTSALELCVLSLAGCILTIFSLVAQRRRLPFEAMKIELEALRPERSLTIATVEGVLRVTTSAPAEDVATALSITLRTCPVGVLLDQARVPVHVRPIVIHTARPEGAAPAA